MSHWNLPNNRSISVPDYDSGDFIAITLGRIPGHSRVLLVGHNPVVDQATTPEDVWPVGGLYPFPAAPVALEVVSTSAADTILGTGARQVTMGLLGADFVEQQVTVALNGLTPVAVPGTWMRINTAGPASVGSGGENAGTIDVRRAGAGLVQGRIPPGAGRLRQAVYTVPAGRVACNFVVTVGCAQSQVRSAVFMPWLRVNGIARTGVGLIAEGTSGTVALETLLPSTAPPGTDLTVRVFSTSGDGVVAWVAVELMIVDETAIQA